MATIIEDYVSYETAKLLKEKGFDIECDNAYHNGILTDCTLFGFCTYGEFIYAPTLQMAMKWLREIHGYVIVVEPGLSEDKYVWTYKVIFYRKRTILLQYKDNIGSSTYEETCEAAIKYCLENLI